MMPDESFAAATMRKLRQLEREVEQLTRENHALTATVEDDRGRRQMPGRRPDGKALWFARQRV